MTAATLHTKTITETGKDTTDAYANYHFYTARYSGVLVEGWESRVVAHLQAKFNPTRWDGTIIRVESAKDGELRFSVRYSLGD